MTHHLPSDEAMLPPCQAACPIHQDIRQYLYSIATGSFHEALKKIREANPLPAICGTICAHHCEDECRRQDVDQALSIRGLKRFAVETGGRVLPEVPSPDSSKKVAVVGGGPSGLTAAWDLAAQGCQVTVFESKEDFGGAVRHYIPLYRLPDEEIDRDIRELKEAGIELKTGVEVGKDVSLADLKQQGYKAILLTTGLPVSRTVPVPGVENQKVMKALPFLYSVKRENFRFEGSPTVVVIGGGNVAMDVARSSARCGAGKVKVTCLECDEEMPAFDWEIEEAKEEGVEFYPAWGPDSVLEEGEDGIQGLRVKKCTAVFDDQGCFSPEFNEENKMDLEGDIIIFSIGQAADLSNLSGELELNERGNIIYDRSNYATSMEGVFTAGEVAEGPGTAVQAMACGRKAALSVMAYLEGHSFTVDSIQEEEAAEKLDSQVAEKVKRIERNELSLVDASKRVTNFEHIEYCFSTNQALDEAKRCLGCLAGANRIDELCANCLTCLRVCPYGVPVINEEGTISIRHEQCQACGLCMGICPAVAIEFSTEYIEQAASQIEPKVKELAGKSSPQEQSVLVLSCAYGDFANPEFIEKYVNSQDYNFRVVRFPCVSKIDSLHILQAFEAGIDSVIVAGCKEEEHGDCPFHDSLFWGEKRVQRARNVLEQLGLPPQKVAFEALSSEQVKEMDTFVKETVKKMEEEGTACAE